MNVILTGGHVIVERFFQRIKNYRHVATRYDKLATCFENFVLLAACVIHF
ncbi:MAG: transposase [Selenomonadaceae bacterium]|nr:transposase [Selenomonadaceae bacterium]